MTKGRATATKEPTRGKRGPLVLFVRWLQHRNHQSFRNLSSPDCVLQEAEVEISHENPHGRGTGDMSHMWEGKNILRMKERIE